MISVKNTKLVIVLISLLTCALITIYIINKNLAAPVLNIEINREFPNITLYDINGEKTDDLFKQNVIYAIYYISDQCEPCINKLPYIKRLAEIFCPSSIRFAIIWKDSIPFSKLDSLNIPPNINYSLKNKVSLSSKTPVQFIISENNILIYDDTYESYTGNTFEDVLIDIADFDEEELKRRTFKAIINQSQLKIDESKPILVYFSFSYCKECKNIYDRLISDTELMNKYNIIHINDTVQEQVGEIIDDNNLFKKIFSINIFPSLLVVDIRLDDFTLYHRYEDIPWR